MIRKQIGLLSVLIIACVLHVAAQKSIIKNITVIVIDKNTDKPIGNAAVTLKSFSNTDLNNETENTDSKGQCRFSFEFEASHTYELFVKKDKYYAYHDLNNNNQSESHKTISAATEKSITLYLTSDSTQLIAYYDQMTPDYQIDELIDLLRTNNYQPDNGSAIPKLTWDDIPKLLEISKDQTKISKFPRNTLSSYYQDSCYVGIVSLWLIESIRTSAQDALTHPLQKFPSLNPYLKATGKQTSTRPPNDVEIMLTTHDAYITWWQSVQKTDRISAAKINPLANTKLSW